jgi:sugar lactone lactonase YvrE
MSINAKKYFNSIGTNARFYKPNGIVCDDENNIYISDTFNNSIRKIIYPTNNVITIAGNGKRGFLNGTGTNSFFNNPMGIRLDENGNLFVSDFGNNVIRKLIKTQNGDYTTTTFFGSGSKGNKNGTYSSSKFNNPTDLDFDKFGNMFVVDSGNNVIRIIKHQIVYGIDESNQVPDIRNLLISSMSKSIIFNNPFGIVINKNLDTIYISDFKNNRICKILDYENYGNIEIIAGNSIEGFMDGAKKNSLLNNPTFLCLDLDGNLYTSDSKNNVIRKINTQDNYIKTIMGNGTIGYKNGSKNNSMFNFPSGICYNLNKNEIYISDSLNNRICKADCNYYTSTLAGYIPRNIDNLVFSSVIGPTGLRGPYGMTGLIGSKGDIGLLGPRGLLGQLGPTGDTGPRGADGPTGLKGEKGDIGPNGINAIGFNYIGEKIYNYNLLDKSNSEYSYHKLSLLNNLDIYSYNNETYIYNRKNINIINDDFPLKVENIPNNLIKQQFDDVGNTNISEIRSILSFKDMTIGYDENIYLLLYIEAKVPNPLYLPQIFYMTVYKTLLMVTNPESNQSRFILDLEDNQNIVMSNIVNNILYLSDYKNNKIIKIVLNEFTQDLNSPICLTSSIYAGDSSSGYLDGNGTNSKFNSPQGICQDISGIVYVSDTNNNRIRKIDTNKNVTTILGNGNIGSTGSEFQQFNNIVSNPTKIILGEDINELYVIEKFGLRKIMLNDNSTVLQKNIYNRDSITFTNALYSINDRELYTDTMFFKSYTTAVHYTKIRNADIFNYPNYPMLISSDNFGFIYILTKMYKLYKCSSIYPDKISNSEGGSTGNKGNDSNYVIKSDFGNKNDDKIGDIIINENINENNFDFNIIYNVEGIEGITGGIQTSYITLKNSLIKL